MLVFSCIIWAWWDWEPLTVGWVIRPWDECGTLSVWCCCIHCDWLSDRRCDCDWLSDRRCDCDWLSDRRCHWCVIVLLTAFTLKSTPSANVCSYLTGGLSLLILLLCVKLKFSSDVVFKNWTDPNCHLFRWFAVIHSALQLDFIMKLGINCLATDWLTLLPRWTCPLSRK